MRPIQSVTSVFLMCVACASAHLKAGSLNPKGGETFAIGQKVLISWVQSQAHDRKYDLYFSKNGGTSWTEFEANWIGAAGDNDTCKYQWTVPANSATTQGQLRVCQMAGGHCTDAAYVLKSGNFTITASSAVQPQADGAAGSLAFDPASRALAVAFSLSAPARVALRAFDARGRLLATLMDEDKSAGDFALSLFSNRLQSMHGAVAFKLDWGAASLTRSLVLP
jgi:hypothetical protein